MRSFDFHAPLARRFPDPVFHPTKGIERHILFVPVDEVPAGLPMDANARLPNINRRVYKEIESSLLDDPEMGEPGSFHLKHKGVTVVADGISKIGDESYRVMISDGGGILDGGHTYALLRKHVENGDLPSPQFVKFEIITKVPPDWIAHLSRGLNTSMQVQPMSLDELQGAFEFIKEALNGTTFAELIAWKEGEDGDLDARDVIGILTLFNVDEFPNRDDGTPPVEGYEKKSAALKRFENSPSGYKKLSPIIPDVLRLHDIIRKEARTYHNEAGGRAGGLSFVEHRKRGKYRFPFIGTEDDYRLMNGALYPMLAAFRWHVVEDKKTGTFMWRDGFDGVLKSWRNSAAELMKMTAQANAELGRSPDKIGKSRNHWANLHARVAMRDLMERQPAMLRR